MTTLSVVGHRAGVHVSVVSRVLNGDPGLRVRDETRQRVERIARELDYVPNYTARALRLASFRRDRAHRAGHDQRDLRRGGPGRRGRRR